MVALEDVLWGVNLLVTLDPVLTSFGHQLPGAALLVDRHRDIVVLIATLHRPSHRLVSSRPFVAHVFASLGSLVLDRGVERALASAFGIDLDHFCRLPDLGWLSPGEQLLACRLLHLFLQGYIVLFKAPQPQRSNPYETTVLGLNRYLFSKGFFSLVFKNHLCRYFLS